MNGYSLIPASFVFLCLWATPAIGADEWTFSWHASEVTGLAFTPDGTELISTSLRDDRRSRMVPGKNPSEAIGEALGKIAGTRSHAVTVDPNGTQIAISGFKVTAVYNLKTFKPMWKIETPPAEYSPPYLTSLAFSADGQWLATSGSSSQVGGPHGYKGGRITILDTKSGKELHRFDDLSHASGSIAFSPDGKLFAAGTHGAGGELPEPGELRVWNANSGKLLHVWKIKETVQAGEEHYAANGIAFSPDSRELAVAYSDGTVRIWDVAKGNVRIELKGHSAGVRRVAFSPDGRQLASGGLDRTVRLWNTATGEPLLSFDVGAPKINALAFRPDGNLLVAGGGDFLRMGEIRMWQLQDSNE